MLLRLKKAPGIVENLPERHKRILLASLDQFNATTCDRLKNLILAYSDDAWDGLKVPNTFLFVPNQSAFSFISYMEDLVTDPDDNLLAKAFIVIQNQKAMLFRTFLLS